MPASLRDRAIRASRRMLPLYLVTVFAYLLGHSAYLLTGTPWAGVIVTAATLLIYIWVKEGDR